MGICFPIINLQITTLFPVDAAFCIQMYVDIMSVYIHGKHVQWNLDSPHNMVILKKRPD